MAIREIVLYPDPRLSQKTEIVKSFDSKLEKLLDDMFETMVAARGLGLAAPQIGELVQVAVIDLSIEDMPPAVISSERPIVAPKKRLELINPKIITAVKDVTSDEGCLSIPEYRDSVKRKECVTVEASDRAGNLFILEGRELLAFALQHEIDHLNGVLFVDHLSRLKRGIFQRWYAKRQRYTEE